MSLPESMSRIVIVGTKTSMDEAIEAFYSLKVIHPIDHTTGADGMSIGSSRPYSSQASERLLKVKAMEKELGINKRTETARMPVDELESQISSNSVENTEVEVLKAVDVRNDLNQRITGLNSKKKNLELLSQIPVDLDLYKGYRTITAIAGTVTADPSAALNALNDIEFFVSFNKKEETGVVAVFMKKTEKDKVVSTLTDFEFSEFAVPEGTGAPADMLTLTNESITALTVELESAEKNLEVLQIKYKTFLRASEEQLTINVEKGSLPLRIAVGDYSYIMDAWVPTKKVDFVKNELETKLGNDVYVEYEETRGRNMHESEECEDRFKKVPTKQNNGKITKEFEYATSLLSTPRYQEIDPSILIMIFLPLFFGYMVGDCGYAIPFIILGAFGLKTTHHKDWRAIALVLFFGGIWAFIFGFFFFGEALGMHFVTANLEDSILNGGTSVSWEYLLGVSMPEWFSGLLPMGHGIGKLDEVSMLLKLAVYVGIVHLLTGYICGIINIAMQHNAKLAFLEKGGWLITFVGMVLFCYVLTQFLFSSAAFEGVLLYMLVIGLVMLIVGTVINYKTEKISAILELPGIVGNILSYTRLTAIGMSKAGMALAFNYIVFGLIIPIDYAAASPDWSANIIFVILGLLLMAFLHLVVWTLAILSAGLHALRLQFVELLNKFFVGGGVLFTPLKIKRDKTILTKNVEKTNQKEVM